MAEIAWGAGRERPFFGRIASAVGEALGAARPSQPDDYGAPRLLLVDWQRQYNVVVWNGRYFGVPRALGEVDLPKADHRALAGLLEEGSYEQLRQRLEQLPVDDGPPVLIEAIGIFNVVVWRGRFFALDRRLGEVDLASGARPDRGLLEAAALEDLRRLVLREKPVDNGEPPALAEEYRRHNIVVWRGRYHGIPQELGEVDLCAAGEDHLKGVLSAESLGALRARIDALPCEISRAAPELLGEHGSYNIVGWNGRFFGIPKALGAVDVTSPGTGSILDVLNAAAVEDLKLMIQQRIWSF